MDAVAVIVAGGSDVKLLHEVWANKANDNADAARMAFGVEKRLKSFIIE